jgi:hypothetical protein
MNQDIKSMKSIARILIAGLILTCSVNLSGQGFSVYLHTDRHSYFAGDTVCFRTYVLKDTNSSSTDANDTLYLKILDQFGLEVASKSYVHENIISGKLILPDNLSEGNYMLVAYMRQMKNEAPDRIFSRILEIRKVSDNYLSTELSLSDTIYQPGATLKAQVRFSGKDNIPVPASFSYQLGGRNEEILSGNGKANSDGIATLKIQLPKFDAKETLELAVDPTYKGTKHSTGVIIPTRFNISDFNTDRINYDYSPETKHLNIQINPGNLQPGRNEKGSFEISVMDENGNPITASLSVSVAGIEPHQLNSESDNLFGFIHKEPNLQQPGAVTDLKIYFAQYLNQKTQKPGSIYIIQEKNNPKKIHKKVPVANRNNPGSNTLFWSPEIITDNEGKATISFSNSVKASEVLISVDGIAANGMAGSASYRFIVK